VGAISAEINLIHHNPRTPETRCGSVTERLLRYQRKSRSAASLPKGIPHPPFARSPFPKGKASLFFTFEPPWELGIGQKLLKSEKALIYLKA